MSLAQGLPIRTTTPTGSGNPSRGAPQANRAPSSANVPTTTDAQAGEEGQESEQEAEEGENEVNDSKRVWDFYAEQEEPSRDTSTDKKPTKNPATQRHSICGSSMRRHSLNCPKMITVILFLMRFMLHSMLRLNPRKTLQRRHLLLRVSLLAPPAQLMLRLPATSYWGWSVLLVIVG